MNTIDITPIDKDEKVFITVRNIASGRTRCVKINDITQSFDYELSLQPTYLSESEAKDFLRVYLEDLLAADLSVEHYYVILAPFMFNNVPITQYIAFNEADPTTSLVTDKLNVGTWFDIYDHAAEALDSLPKSLQGCKIKRITITA